MSGHPTVWQEDYQSKVRDLHQAKARIRTLEAQIAEYKEAVRVLARGFEALRRECSVLSVSDNAGPNFSQRLRDAQLDSLAGIVVVKNNPIAKAAIEGSEP